MSVSSHPDEVLAICVTINPLLFLEIGTGVSANTFLFLFHILNLFLEHRHKPTDLVICHLTLVHIMQLFVLLFLSPELFDSLNFQNTVKCKAFFYLGRLMRGLSICTTCLLSVRQAATISPSTACIAHFKHKSIGFMLQCFFIFWLIHLCLSSNIVFYTVASSNVTQARLLNVNKYCSLSAMHSMLKYLLIALTLSRDVFSIGLMLLSSSHMVLLLVRHQRRCQHLHSSSQRFSPEKRATQTILLLVSFFVLVYWVDFLISSFSVLLWTYDSFILCFQSLVLNLYASVSPLVLMSSDQRILTLLQNMCKLITLNKK